MNRAVPRLCLTLSSLALATLASGSPEGRPRVPHDFFRSYIKLTEQEVAVIDGGRAVAKILKTKEKPEVRVFGAVYVNAPPEDYLRFFRDVASPEKAAGYLAGRRLSDPPTLADLEGFALDAQELDDLRGCKVGDCPFQFSAQAIQEFRERIDWAAPDAAGQVNRRVQELVLEGLQLYRAGGLQALGEYRDKKEPTRVAERFATLLSHSDVWPEHIPELRHYLLEYPAATLEGAEDYFTWEKVDIGLKPTLRLNHVTIVKRPLPGQSAYAFAIKQLHASHYFQTAVDLSFCVADSANPAREGFYLITLKASRQDGLTGLLGSLTRRVVLSRTRSATEKTLNHTKAVLEAKRAH